MAGTSLNKADIRFEVLAIVVNYNAGEWLIACIKSLLSSQQRLDICVVDNASSDDSIRRLNNEFGGLQQLEVIENDENIGFARANNQVLRSRQAEYYALVNPDCEIEHDSVSKILGVMRNDGDIGLASCLIKNADGSIQKTCRRKFPTPWTGFARALGLSTLFPNIFEDFDCGDRKPSGEVEYVEAVSGGLYGGAGQCAEKGRLSRRRVLHAL